MRWFFATTNPTLAEDRRTSFEFLIDPASPDTTRKVGGCTDRGSQSRAVHSFLLVAKLVTNYSGLRLSLVYLPAFNYRSIVSASFAWIDPSFYIYLFFSRRSDESFSS